MTTWIKVARYHLLDRTTYVLMPWGALAFGFAIDLVIGEVLHGHPAASHFVWGLAAIVITLVVAGVLSMTRELPFGLALGCSRITYYLGTVLLGLTLALVYGLAIVLLQGVERATGGWGLGLRLFRVPFLLDGTWYATWLTSGVTLVLLFLYGAWCGLIHRRWGLPGLEMFLASQIVALLGGTLVVTWTDAWPRIGGLFASLTATGVTGILALIAVVVLGGGLATIRRVTV